MKYIYLILGMALFYGCGQPLTEEQKNADAVYLDVVDEYQHLVNLGVTQNHLHSHKLLLQTHASFNRMYGESFIVYNPDIQYIKTVKAETEKTDGKIIPSGENALNPVLPRFAKKSKQFNHLREMVVTHLGTEVGAILNLEYELKSQKEYTPPALMENIVLAKGSPIKKLKIIVKIPEGEELQYKLMNIDGKPRISKGSGMQIYTWTFKNIPAIKHEQISGERDEHLPRLLFSIAKPEQIKKIFETQDAFKYRVNDEMKAEVDSLVKDKKTSLEKVIAIQKIVNEKVALTKVPFYLAGFKSKTAKKCWKSNSGTKIEKSVLLAALLKAVEIPAEVVGVVPKVFIEEDVFNNLSYLDEFLVKVEIPDEETIYLSAVKDTNKDIQMNMNDCYAYNIKSGKITNFKPQTSNNVKMIGKFEVSQDKKIKGNAQLTLKGGVCPNILLKIEPEKAKNLIHFSGDVKSVLKSLESRNANVKFELTGTKPLEEYGGYYTWELPCSTEGLESYNITALTSERTAPVQIKPIEEEYSFEISLPENVSLVTPEIKISEKSSIADLDISIEFEEGKVIISKKIKIKSFVSPSSQYADFRKILNEWQNPKYQKLIFK